MSEWKWIDVKERTPEDGERVVVLFKDGSRGSIDWDSRLWAIQRATHWMPIPPDPPKMVTIEISEEDARAFGRGHRLGNESDRISLACLNAIAKLEWK